MYNRDNAIRDLIRFRLSRRTSFLPLAFLPSEKKDFDETEKPSVAVTGGRSSEIAASHITTAHSRAAVSSVACVIGVFTAPWCGAGE